MRTKTTFTLLIITVFYFFYFILNGCTSQPENRHHKKAKLKGTISISGAFALYPMTVKWAEEFMQLNPGVRIDISAGGAGKGMADVLSEMVDLAMVSREIAPAEIEKGAWYLAVCKDAVLGTINESNPYVKEIKQYGISRETLTKIYIDVTIENWDQIPGISANNQKINVYTRSDACGAAEMWGLFFGKNQESLQGIGVFGDPGIADAVKNDKFGIGFNNVIYAFDINTRKKFEGLEIIPIDLNNNGVIDPDENFYDNLDDICAAIGNEQYPSPPARDLYLISKGEPKNLIVIEFLKWILTEGQQYVNDAGYVRLSESKIETEMQKIK